jgi:hypothetical protein
MFEIAVEEKIFLVQPIQAPSRFSELHSGQVMLHVKFKVLSKTAVPLNSKPCSNDVFGDGDTCRGHTKSLLTVYRYGRKTPQMKIAAENSCISVSTIPESQPYADLIDPHNFLEDGDRLLPSMECLSPVTLIRKDVSTQRRLEALPGMHCNSLILSIFRDAPSLFD